MALDPRYLEILAQVESSGNPNAEAKTSSAAGLYQFTEGTWKSMVKQLDLDYNLDDRFDPDKSAKVVEALTEENRKYLEKKLDREVNHGELYLAHLLGAKGAYDTIRKVDLAQDVSSLDVLPQDYIASNPGVFANDDGSIKSVFEIYNWANDKFNTGKHVTPLPKDAVSYNNALLPNDPAVQQYNEEFGLPSNIDPTLLSNISDFNFSTGLIDYNITKPNTPEQPKVPDEESPTFDSNFSQDNNFAYTKDIRALKKGGFVESSEPILEEINAGGSHEENPLKGVPMGPNSKGGMNLVEEGEVKFMNYIFPKSTRITKEAIERFSLNDKYEGWSYADAMKDLWEPVKERAFDKMTKSSAEKNTYQYILANEEEKMKHNKKNKDNQMFAGGALLGSLLPMAMGQLGSTVSTLASGNASGGEKAGTLLSNLPGIGSIAGGLMGSFFQNKRLKEERIEQANEAATARNSMYEPGGTLDPNDPILSLYPQYNPYQGLSGLPGFDYGVFNISNESIVQNLKTPTERSGIRMQQTPNAGVGASRTSVPPVLNSSTDYVPSERSGIRLQQTPNAGPSAPRQGQVPIMNTSTDYVPNAMSGIRMQRTPNAGPGPTKQLANNAFYNALGLDFGTGPGPLNTDISKFIGEKPNYDIDQTSTVGPWTFDRILNNPKVDDSFSGTRMPGIATGTLPTKQNQGTQGQSRRDTKIDPITNSITPTGSLLAMVNGEEIDLSQPLQGQALLNSLNPDPFDQQNLDSDYQGVVDQVNAAGMLMPSQKENDEEDKKFDPTSLLRYAPMAGNLGRLMFGDNKPDKVSLDRINQRFTPGRVDEEALRRPIREQAANMKRQVAGMSGGSANAAMAGMLASQVNNVKAEAEAMFKGQQFNIAQQNQADAMNYQVNAANTQQANQEKMLNMRAESAAQQRKDSLVDSLLTSAGDLGKEKMLGEILAKVTGYKTTGDYVGTDSTAKKGGLLDAYIKGQDPKNKMITEFIRMKYGY